MNRTNPGDIYLVRTGGQTRLVLVLDNPMGLQVGIAHIAMVSDEIEKAAQFDYRVTQQESGLHFDAVIETDLVAWVWEKDLDRKVGSLDETLMSEVEAIILGLHEGGVQNLNLDSDRLGPPLTSNSDWRYEWKNREFRSLLDLSGECMEFLLESDKALKEEIRNEPSH
jgi:mRNA-degrading endonuclease toxin of MazEF toxin-antitoxin module